MIETSFKTELVNETQSRIAKARINDAIEINAVFFSVTADSLTINFQLPPDMVVIKVELLNPAGGVVTTIPGLNIDTSISTAFSHNIHFVQGGV